MSEVTNASNETEKSHLHNGWLLFLGVVLIVLGVLAIAVTPFFTGLVVVQMLGILLVAGGLVQVIQSFTGHHWRGFVLSLLGGILYFVLGLMCLRHPGLAMESLTLLIAMLLMVVGMTRILTSLIVRFEQWGWTALNGLISLVLGAGIWAQWPWSGLWVLGTFVGIEMIFAGWSLVMLRMALHHVNHVIAGSGRPAIPTV
jgi:uncharacterized membrane protein HdeD (DUF308 family)